MSEEISKHTIVILVVLTVVISFLGTWTVMHEVSKVNVDADNTQTVAHANTGGQATIVLLETEQTGKATIELVES